VVLDLYGGVGAQGDGGAGGPRPGGEHFGEIALLWPYLPGAAREQAPRPDGARTATVTALDHVEALWVSRKAVAGFLDKVAPGQPGPAEAKWIAAATAAAPAGGGQQRPPRSGVEAKLVLHCVALLNKNSNPPTLTRSRPAPAEGLRTFDRADASRQAEYVRLGLYQGQKLLVLDLDRCTRCDECARACADSHGGRDRAAGQQSASRLFREGPRFGRFLVAACCRSCHKPYCLDGCPVDAIHRKGQGLAVVIDNWCIGCGLCERNCPYGAIQMVPTADTPAGAARTAAVQQRAVNCDLCQGLVPPGGEPFCVRACPHEAAFRYSGEELLEETLPEGPA
jgi:Fe-S-cluster-containing dehydrogenase component